MKPKNQPLIKEFALALCASIVFNCSGGGGGSGQSDVSSPGAKTNVDTSAATDDKTSDNATPSDPTTPTTEEVASDQKDDSPSRVLEITPALSDFDPANREIVIAFNKLPVRESINSQTFVLFCATTGYPQKTLPYSVRYDEAKKTVSLTMAVNFPSTDVCFFAISKAISDNSERPEINVGPNEFRTKIDESLKINLVEGETSGLSNRLIWDKVNAANNYQIRWSRSGANSYPNFIKTNGPSRCFVHASDSLSNENKLLNNQEYEYAVAAVTSIGGVGPYSSAIKLTATRDGTPLECSDLYDGNPPDIERVKIVDNGTNDFTVTYSLSDATHVFVSTTDKTCTNESQWYPLPSAVPVSIPPAVNSIEIYYAVRDRTLQTACLTTKLVTGQVPIVPVSSIFPSSIAAGSKVVMDGSILYHADRDFISVSADLGGTMRRVKLTDSKPAPLSIKASGNSVAVLNNYHVKISNDGAQSFTDVPLAEGGQYVSSPVVAVNDTSVFFATSSATGLTITSDGGKTLVKKNTSDGLYSPTISSITVRGGNVAIIHSGQSKGLSFSSDSGATFRSTSLFNAFGSGVSSASIVGYDSTGKIYLEAHSYDANSGYAFAGMYSSSNGGVSFALKTPSTQFSSYNYHSSQFIGDNIYVILGNKTAPHKRMLFVSKDGGTTYSEVPTVESVDAILSSASSSSIALSVGNGRILISQDGGVTFKYMNPSTSIASRGEVVKSGSKYYQATKSGLKIFGVNDLTMNFRTNLNSGLCEDTIYASADGSYVHSASGACIASSSDGGTTFSQKRKSPGSSGNYSAIAAIGSKLYVQQGNQLLLAESPSQDFASISILNGKSFSKLIKLIQNRQKIYFIFSSGFSVYDVLSATWTVKDLSNIVVQESQATISEITNFDVQGADISLGAMCSGGYSCSYQSHDGGNIWYSGSPTVAWLKPSIGRFVLEVSDSAIILYERFINSKNSLEYRKYARKSLPEGAADFSGGLFGNMFIEGSDVFLHSESGEFRKFTVKQDF